MNLDDEPGINEKIKKKNNNKTKNEKWKPFFIEFK